MKVLETERLIIQHLSTDDKQFILTLLNQPSFLQNIGDRKVRTEAEASLYIAAGPVESYRLLGFGLFLVLLKDGNEPIGICGLLKRDFLEDVDIGFAFLEQFWGCGYAAESAAAVLEYGRRTAGLARIVAITKPGNESSMKTLRRIGMEFAGEVQLPGMDTPSNLFAIDFS